MKHTSKLLTALLLTMAFLVSALPVHGIHAEPETATVQKNAELVFVIDSTGSMGDAINNVKTGITSFVNSLETQGVKLRIGIVEYRDIEEDGLDSTIIHELNHSPWMNSTSEMVGVLGGIAADGGGDIPESVIDGLGYLVDGETIPWSSDSYKFAVVLTDAGYKVANRHGFNSLQEVADALLHAGINTSVVTEESEFSTYEELYTTTGGTRANIYSDFSTVLADLANQILGLTGKSKKAIYVLPGYLGSELYDGPDGTAGGDLVYVSIPRLMLNMTKFFQDADSNGTRLHVDYARDEYGANGTYKTLVDRLRAEFVDEYDVRFFPYNWLEDLNDSVKKLERDIRKNHYDSVIFVTHSTGGLLASAFIAKSNANKLLVSKAILIAAPLFGTYASLLPIERGDSRKFDFNEILSNIDWFSHGLDAITPKSWVRGWAKNSPTTYQLLPSSEYIRQIPMLNFNSDNWWSPWSNLEAIGSIGGYYRILNGSERINLNLTNGTDRSHRYFRETALKGDVISQWSLASLMEVDTLLICTTSGHSTTKTVLYRNGVFGGKKLDDIIYNRNGDGTVQGISATGAVNGIVKLRVDYYSADHGGLCKDSEVLSRICSEIRGMRTPVKNHHVADTAGISELIKIRYKADVPVTATIYDAENNVVAQVSSEGITGFEENDFIFDSFADAEEDGERTEASIYMPNGGYKILFTHGNSADVSVNFNAYVSTLVDDGWKDFSVITSVASTYDSGLIASFDGTTQVIDNDTITEIVGGTAEDWFTEWEIPSAIKVNKGDVLPIEISGSETGAVSDKLVWHSADESIARVSESGVLTAVGYGKTIISATDGNKAVTSEVTVVQNATAVSFSDVEMVIGERTLIRPSFEPVSTTETELTYSMDKEGIIEINEFGVMHALAEGSVIVTGTTAYGVSGQFTVTVKDDTNYGVESIALPATAKVGLNNKITLDVEFTPVNATNKNIKWYVEDDSIIRLTPGDAQAEIIGTKLGTTKVTAVSEDGGHVAECIVTVTEKEVGPPETGAVSMVLTGIMLVVAGIAVNMGKRRKKH
ncbi:MULTISPECIES: Ig-like domain-containing protein [Oscillospiraceae]|uniref:Ig-like domain-containing protein n=1 Tax=Lawsonibacter faecis TaxID=2763052 RepID=A0A8J6JJ32_9FIRM|nr:MULTISPECIES: Ig-like domain-containing protein [Oscillospiraceae]MBC5736197.1 Ig-like domain-containing protein [Lawsonibacter faecis]